MSNTNQIHIDFVNQHLLNDLPINHLKDAFDGTYYSHEIGERKPNKEAFQFVLNKEEIKASETLFIDDKLENIETANT
ncbi:MAG: HAD-IA family hydrolase [Chitinophagales bacterium]|nr:HAD-IA family hydrolase [Chitinophagales bacterium]